MLAKYPCRLAVAGARIAAFRSIRANHRPPPRPSQHGAGCGERLLFVPGQLARFEAGRPERL